MAPTKSHKFNDTTNASPLNQPGVGDYKVNGLLASDVKAAFEQSSSKALSDPSLNIVDLPLVSLPADQGLFFWWWSKKDCWHFGFSLDLLKTYTQNVHD